ncbi:hypothetical protein FGF67_06520 [Tamlana fucoidanivorans]|uniref:Uncharacterized protein n=1 Tax=Allotamlana fucoidanivorans TaxID=2583814 RepID=A0A5C4SNY7_9FLAO|nr:hypothetical protein FGF67_06520 [Tamlana fucoidanivorans]
MTTFDMLFFHVFQYYKNKKVRKADAIATCYLTFLQCALLLLLGVFFSKFFKQMHVETMSSSKAWTLYVIAVVFIYFKNWMQYGGRKRKVRNANILKNKRLNYSIWLIWFVPFSLLALSYILYQAF